MNSKLKRFGELERLAEGEELAASRRLKECIEEVLTERTKLDQLRDYLEDYRKGDGSATNQQLDPVRWENYRRFLGRLSETIEAQQQELDQAEARYREEAGRWQASHARTETMSRLLQKFETEQRRELAAREQKEQDDRASRSKDS